MERAFQYQAVRRRHVCDHVYIFGNRNEASLMALMDEVVKGVSPQERVKYRTMVVDLEAFEMVVKSSPASYSHV